MNPETTAEQEQAEAARLWAELPDHGAEVATPIPDATLPADVLAGASQAEHEAEALRMHRQYEELRASSDRAADQPGSKLGDTLDQGLADYPEIARPVKDALAPIEQKLERLDRLEAQQRSVQEAEVNGHIRSQQELLEQAHPGWEKEYVQGQKAKEFLNWIQSPDRTVKQVKTVFETNRDHIFDAAAAIEVFDAFRNDTAASPAGNGLSARRAAQLDGSRSPRSPGGVSRMRGVPRDGDPKSIWDALPDDNADDRLTRR